jgi:DNA polymerase III epsilon subunit-like protein
MSARAGDRIVALPLAPTIGGRPGTMQGTWEVARPGGYAVFDCETTGTDVAADEIVSFALVLLDPDGAAVDTLSGLVRPSRAIPAEATDVHGIADADVVDAPPFAAVAKKLLELLDGAVFVAHNVGFDLPMLQHALAQAGLDYHPPATACTLEAFRLLDPLAENHRLESICARHGIPLDGAHEATSDVQATVALLRVLLSEGIAPESVRLDHTAYQRLRSRGDTRPASEPQIRRVFGLARSAGLLRPDGTVDREQVVAVVAGATGRTDVDDLTRAEVQDVYDALDELIDRRAALAPAASA